MAAFALHAAVVIFSAYTVSGIVLAPVIIIALAMRWRIDRALILPMMSWGAVGVVGLAFAMRMIEGLTQA
jgi:hypothetical protein